MARNLWRASRRLSVPRDNMDHEGTTTKVGPGRSCSSTWPGPRPTTKGTTGLMHSVEPTSDTTPPPPCPLCGTPASATRVRADNAIRIGDYRCPSGHIWTTRWLVAA